MGKNKYWKYGEQTRIAVGAGISEQHFNDILRRVRGVSPNRAARLETVAKAYGKDIPWTAFLFNKTTYHPAFIGEPRPSTLNHKA